MNTDKLKLWIDALRSGNYQQGQGYLTQKGIDPGEFLYCCLGVACEVAIQDGLGLEVDDMSSLVSYDGEDQFLPAKVRGWLGVNNAPMVSVPEGRLSVIDLNDEHESTFDEIADALEREYLKGKS